MDGLILEQLVVDFITGKVLEARVSDPPIFADADVQVDGLTEGDHQMLVDELAQVRAKNAAKNAVGDAKNLTTGTIMRRDGTLFLNDAPLDEQTTTALTEMLFVFNPLLHI